MNYILDFSGIKTMYDLHQYLKDTLELPDYYGMNFDALWDCFRGGFPEATTIELRNLEDIPKDMEKPKEILLEVFHDLVVEYPEVKIIYN